MRALGALLAAVVLVAAGCSSSGKAAAARKPATTTNAGCRPPAADPAVPVSTPVAGVASDRDLTSFDGTKIRVHWFPIQGRSTAPTLLMGPGWGMAGDTNTRTAGVPGSLSIRTLQNAGYNVLTWDPRGFGRSGGTIEVDSPAFEGRDVQRIIDWVAAQPGVQLDGTRDPRLGMLGVSYGGGIQLTTAPIDCRVDAIVPSWAWHSLTTSLAKNGVYKAGWSTLLYAAARGHSLDPHITAGNAYANTHGTVDPVDVDWFAQRGPGDAVSQIRVPTLFVQGESDNLFTLQEAVTNYDLVKRTGVPTAMLWTCGGHGVCLTNPGDPTTVAQATLAWLARYVQRDQSVATVAKFAFIDQNGVRYTAADYPLPTGAPLVGDGHGTLNLVATGGSGPANTSTSRDPLASVAGIITPGRASNALDVDIAAGSRAAVVVGAPQLRITYRGTAPAGERPTAVFAQVVDDATGIVVGNQITPVALTLDGQTHTATVPLEIIAFAARPGSRLTLQLVPTTVAYAQPRLGGQIEFDAVHVELPVAAGLNPA
jgi:ABC-2 type transport system ATP-binding protein